MIEEANKHFEDGRRKGRSDSDADARVKIEQAEAALAEARRLRAEQEAELIKALAAYEAQVRVLEAALADERERSERLREALREIPKVEQWADVVAIIDTALAPAQPERITVLHAKGCPVNVRTGVACNCLTPAQPEEEKP